MINEMKMHMSWPEACFQAETASSCAEEIKRWLPKSSPVYRLTLRDAVEQVCREGMNTESQRTYAQLGPLNLFAIVSGKYLKRRSRCMSSRRRIG
jgi:hypothetical protein